MYGTVQKFCCGYWLVKTDKGTMLLNDWQCRTGMVPGKRVRLTNKAGRWYASEVTDDKPSPG